MKKFTTLLFEQDKINYRSVKGKCTFAVSDVEYFKEESNSVNASFFRFDKIEICYGQNKRLKYTIESENKEHFIFLLNLLKTGIEQR